MRRNRIVHLALAALAALLVVPALPRPAAGQVAGNTYTSPTYGFSITWDAPWYVFQEIADPATGDEGIVLTNVPSRVLLVGTSAFGDDVDACAGALVPSLVTDPQVSNFQPLTDADGELVMGGDAGRAYAGFAFTYTDETGQAYDNVHYSECRALPGGEAVLQILHVALAEYYASEVPAREALLANLVQPEPPSPGEPAPVFVSGAWRVAVVAAERAARLPDLGAEEQQGADWLAVVADVTAWAPDSQNLAADALAVLVGEDGDPIDADLTASVTAAEALDLLAPVEGGIPFEADQTQRLVLLFSIPADAEEPTLVRGGARLPLGPTIAARRAATDDLPEVFGPPELEEASVTSVIDGHTVEVTLVADGTSRTVDLIGVAAPTGDDCFAAEAVEGLADLAGDTIWLEAEVGVDDAGPRYAWTEKRDGTRILVNRKLLERGYAERADLDEDARFGDWLAEAAREAEAAGEGLWSACADGAAQAESEESDATEPVATEEAETAGALTDADRAYLSGWREARTTLDVSLTRYGELVANPLPGDPQWLNQMAFVFVAWVMVHDAVETLDPPERFADLHSTCAGATAVLDLAAHEQIPNVDDWLSGASSTVDIAGFDLGLLQTRYAEAEPLLTACFAHLDTAGDESGL